MKRILLLAPVLAWSIPALAIEDGQGLRSGMAPGQVAEVVSARGFQFVKTKSSSGSESYVAAVLDGSQNVSRTAGSYFFCDGRLSSWTTEYSLYEAQSNLELALSRYGQPSKVLSTRTPLQGVGTVGTIQHWWYLTGNSERLGVGMTLRSEQGLSRSFVLHSVRDRCTQSNW